MTGTITDPLVKVHHSSSPARIDEAIRAEIRRLNVEADRVSPLVDRLEAMRSLYPATEDLSGLGEERLKIQEELGASCSLFVKGTDLLHDMMRARASSAIQSLMARGFDAQTGGYANLVKAHDEAEDLVQVRERICQVTALESEAFGRRVAELEALRKRRAQARWGGGAALLLVGGAGAFALRRRRAASAWPRAR